MRSCVMCGGSPGEHAAMVPGTVLPGYRPVVELQGRWQEMIEARLLDEAKSRDWAHMPDHIFFRLLRNIAAGGIDPRHINGRTYTDGRELT